MEIRVENRCPDASSYRAASVKSLFNVDNATSFDLRADLPDPGGDWRLGVVVGPSGSGKSSIGRRLVEDHGFIDSVAMGGWDAGAPIIDGIAPGADLNVATGALGQVGLGDVPAWLRPYAVLSTGQRFRADLARIVADPPQRVVVDEFTSVVDRQIARVGAAAFAKGWRRGSGQHAVLLTCHYDVLEWLEPDWVFDTATGELARGRLHRPRIEVEVRSGGWGLWPLFSPHHYLETGPMPAAQAWVGFVDGEPVVHLGMGTRGVSTRGGTVLEARGCRMVVMPEWQGAGVGMRFLNHVCGLYLAGDGVGACAGRRVTTIFHTSHPLLSAALRRDPNWRQVSGALYGVNQRRSRNSMRPTGMRIGYGGHFRAIQGFRYVGNRQDATA